MDSSEEEPDFPSHEWVTPQSKINSIYQSITEKGIRKLCTELLELKDAVDNLSGNKRAKYTAFLRVTGETLEFRKHCQKIRLVISSR
ncbi:unnamed protein product [Victoria cruziana]